MELLFRADGSAKKGMGHIVRSIALAEEFRDRGHFVLFMVKEDQQAKAIIEKRHFEHIQYEENQQKLVELLKEKEIRVFISDVDEYSASFFSELRNESIYSVQIDIHRKMNLGVDLLVNGGIYGKELEEEAKNASQKALLGAEYNLLRKEFSQAKPKVHKEEIEHVLITLGATDVHNLTEVVTLLAMKVFPQALIHVVQGSDKNPFNSEELSQNPQLIVYHKTPYMLQLMEKADLAICSGGITLYELAACGTPSLVITQAENQVRQTAFFATLEALIYYGSSESYREETFKQHLEKLKDPILRYRLSHRARKTVDGKGVERVVDYILSECR